MNFVPITCLMSSFDIRYGLVTGFRTESGGSHAPPQELRMSCASFCGAPKIDFIEELFALGIKILFLKY